MIEYKEVEKQYVKGLQVELRAEGICLSSLSITCLNKFETIKLNFHRLAEEKFVCVCV